MIQSAGSGGNQSSAGVVLSEQSSHPADRDVAVPTVAESSEVTIRRCPWPYRAMLAVCSDLDETPDAQVYWNIARFLNTSEAMAMGSGVDLEVGNSIFFDMPPNQFSYWGTDDTGRAMVRSLIASGHVDCLHSYGDLAKSRRDAARALDELHRHSCRLGVWVDHSKAPSNFGPDIMCGRGDIVDDEVYHADLTLQYGIRYVWRGRTTGINGQNVPLSPSAYAHMWDFRHPFGSARTVVKEAAKIHLGRAGHPRWQMYGENRVCRPSCLRDGQAVWEFLRSNPFWAGSGRGDTADGIAEVLTSRMLRQLMRREGICILYTHLGKVMDPTCPFGPQTQEAFRRLARLRDEGHILVTTTHRLLRYLTTRDSLQFDATQQGGVLTITIDEIHDPVFGARRPSMDELQGVTFDTPPADEFAVTLSDGRAIACDVVRTGKRMLVTIPWRPLVFPAI